MSYGETPLEEIKTTELLKELNRRHHAVRLMRCPYCNVPVGVENHTCKYAKNQEHFTEGLERMEIR